MLAILSGEFAERNRVSSDRPTPLDQPLLRK